jgi:hypothetical protein
MHDTSPPTRSSRPVIRNKRKIPKQATSSVAFELAPPAPDDPLLGFIPVPHARPRANSITPDVQRAFIAQLAATGIVSAAARHVGKSMEALYKLRQRPGAEGFRAAWDAALDRGVSRLEDSALARALQGEERLILHAGEVIGAERRHNEALVMFFLRNRLPHRYGAQHTASAATGSAQQVDAQGADERSDERTEKRLDAMIGQWRRQFIKLWEARLAAVGIDLADPRFAERAETLKAEGRWPEETTAMFEREG